jgi:tetratricopeptide (TPR) repeat protein
MSYDITYHPASKADIQQAYFKPLNETSANEEQLCKLSPEDKQRYLTLIKEGKQVKNTQSFDTTHGYYASVALGFFQPYYYIRGASFSFLLETYPYYRKYLERWHNILPDFSFNQQVSNEIVVNYSSGVFLSSAGVKQLWDDYHNNPITKLELDFYFDADIQQFLSALHYAHQQNKGLLEASEVYSPFEGNASSKDNLIVKNDTPFDFNPSLSLEKQYYQAVNKIFDNRGKPKFTPLEQLKTHYPFPEKIEFALGWLKDSTCELPEAELHYHNAIELGFNNFIVHHFYGEFYRLIKKDNKQAVEQYQLSLSKNPNYELNHIRIGDIAEVERDWKTAKAAYEKAIAINPIHAEYHNNLGVYECNLFNFGQGIKHYRRATQLNPQYFQAYKNLTWQLYKSGEYEESQMVALLSLEKFKDLGNFYDVLGRASLKMGNRQKAIDYFKTSIRECPNYPESYCELSDIYENESEKGLSIINKCLINNPKYGFGYYKRAKKHSKNGSYQQAEVDFLKAIDLGDTTANTYTSLGFVYSEGLKQPQKAIDTYKKAIEVDPRYEMAHRNMAISYWDLGESNEALQKLDDALKLVPDTYTTLFNKGIYLQRLKRYNEAIIAFQNLIRYYPNNHKGQVNLAFNYYDTKQYRKAIEHFKIALTIDPNHYNSAFYAALSCYFLKDDTQAIVYYSRAIELKPNNAKDYFNRGLCYENVGNKNKAISDYEKAVVLDANYEKAYDRLKRLKKNKRKC